MPTDNGHKTYDDGDWEQPDAPASEQDIAAHAEFEAGYRAADASALEVANRLIEQMRRDEKRLQAELAATRQQVAAAAAKRISTEYMYIGLQRNTIKWLFDDTYKHDSSEEEDSDYVKDTKIVEAIKEQNVTITHLKQQLKAALQATPQPAPSDLRAAVAPFLSTAHQLEVINKHGQLYHFNYHLRGLTLTFEDFRRLAAALKAGE